jgi:spore germination protein YaaH
MSKTNPLFRPTKNRRLVSAWVCPGQNQAVLDRVREFRDAFDQIILMSGAVDPGGGLQTTWPTEDRIELAKSLREMGISVLVDYGGRWSEPMRDSFRSPALLKSYVAKLVEDCEAVGADGVDIDIEGWPADTRNIYTDFMALLSEALRSRDKLVSLCVMSLSREARRETGVGFIDPVLLAPHVDHFRCMTYDLFCPPSLYVGPTSIAPWGRESMQYMVSRVACEKVVMGLPTYSVDWDINDPTKSRQVNDHKWIAEREAESPIGRGWCYYWDVGLIRYTDKQGHAHLLWVSDARSTRSHLVTVDSLDLAGVCFWLLNGEDDPRIWEAVREHFRR